MSKIYIVGHDDGRRVYEHVKLPQFYVKSEPCNDPELRLFRTRSRKEAEKICETTVTYGGWSGFKVQVLKRKKEQVRYDKP